MAKFKVGDTVKFCDPPDYPFEGRSVYDGKTGEVVKIDGYVHVKFRDGNVRQCKENELVAANARACNSSNPVVRNAMNSTVAMNKPYDIPMGADDDEKIDIHLEEFSWQYGVRENPRPIHTTFDKLHSYIARFGLDSQESTITRKLRRGESYTVRLPVTLSMVFTPA